MDTAVIVTLANIIFTPIIVLITMAVRNHNDKEIRQDRRDDEFIKSLKENIGELRERVAELERSDDVKNTSLAEIRVELKNRDTEYVKLYQEHATLRAKYEILSKDHDSLKKEYDITAKELATFKEDIKSKATQAAEELKTI